MKAKLDGKIVEITKVRFWDGDEHPKLYFKSFYDRGEVLEDWWSWRPEGKTRFEWIDEEVENEIMLQRMK